MKTTVTILVVAVLLLIAAFLVAEEKMGAPILVIPGGSKPDVTLPHELHQSTLGDCDLCHNLFPQTAGSIVKLKEAGTLKKMQVMKQCQGCHKEMEKSGQEAGPVKCDGCHKE